MKTLVEGRRGRMARALGHPLAVPLAAESPLDGDVRAHLHDEAEDLYWNELEWEHITAEEETVGGPVVPLTFPGLLAFVRGLLLEEVMPDALAPAEPRPEVVEDIVRFLAGRVVELEEALAGSDAEEPDRLRVELALTDRLVDQVLYLFHAVPEDEIARLEAAQVEG
ncbi:MAG TPA: hypothetical protein VE173_05345 [Longimicrobiales bacterium]|nr:hypothetical protein [Longimicrobiales bacterium]